MRRRHERASQDVVSLAKLDPLPRTASLSNTARHSRCSGFGGDGEGCGCKITLDMSLLVASVVRFSSEFQRCGRIWAPKRALTWAKSVSGYGMATSRFVPEFALHSVRRKH